MTNIVDKWTAPGPQPNGLQAADDGLWLIDQTDNHLYKLAYEDGSTLARLPTDDRPLQRRHRVGRPRLGCIDI